RCAYVMCARWPVPLADRCQRGALEVFAVVYVFAVAAVIRVPQGQALAQAFGQDVQLCPRARQGIGAIEIWFLGPLWLVVPIAFPNCVEHRLWHVFPPFR